MFLDGKELIIAPITPHNSRPFDRSYASRHSGSGGSRRAIMAQA
jgi:hypothetical protein